MLRELRDALETAEVEHGLLIDVLDAAMRLVATEPADASPAVAVLRDAIAQHQECFGEAEPNLCADCGRDTTPWKFTRPAGGWEWYMVTAELWERATFADPARFLCIGCLENRLGRTLNARDFPLLPVNKPSELDSERLRDRLST